MSLLSSKNNFLVTDLAAQQINVIKENDYTTEGLVFRMKIGGKGCGGFTYDTGFSEPLDDDTVVNSEGVDIYLDPFTYHYCSDGVLDYQMDPDTKEEGFVFTNNNEHLFEGKFFKDESLVPKHLEIN